ncbi:MAG: membrane associated rhomboid family serine protease [Arenicella sp.]|jgi:membrane associated rhomboid family serine protease
MKLTFNSPVILVFSALCAGVYLLQSLNMSADMFVLMPNWDMGNPAWYFRIFSHALGHGSMEHLMGNLAFILLLGPIVEEKYGAKNLIIMMFSTAVITGIIHLSFSNSGLLGASGIVFMLILLVSLVNFKNKEIPLTFVLIVLVYIGKEVLGTFTEDQVAHSTHIVGGIVGAFFGFMLGGKKAKAKTTSGNIDLLK